MLQVFYLGQIVNELNNYEYVEYDYQVNRVVIHKTIEEKIAETFPEEKEIMLAVAKCESNFNQDAVSHTRDFGVMQINERTWHDTAEEMGLDYKNSEDDNLKLARHIYEVQGLSAWVCYKKLFGELALK